jgi:alpha-tubulin suppressor-like RCC1 family protein
MIKITLSSMLVFFTLLFAGQADSIDNQNVNSDANKSITSFNNASTAAPTLSIRSFREFCAFSKINSISAKATGNAPFTYQWRHAGVDIPGATADTLFFPSMAAGDFGTYTCVVTTPNGSVESNTVTLRLDSDGDGLPDDWEVANFGDLTKTGPQDSDGDGTSNEQELADGTNPNNPAEARVALTLLGLPGGTVTVAPPDVRPMKGSTVTLTATNADGLFRAWTGASTATTPTVTLTMDGDKEIGAIFDQVTTWGKNGGLAPVGQPIGARDVERISLGNSGAYSVFSDGDLAAGWPGPLPGPGVGVQGSKSGQTITLSRTGRVLYSSLGPVPTTVGDLTKVAAAGHAVGLRKDGTVACWGASSYGRTATPLGLSGIIDVATTNEGSYALRSDGTLVIWGTFAVRPSAELTNVRAIAGGREHVVALKRDGTIVMWGSGQSQGTYANAPTSIPDAVAISAGAYHTMVLKADGTIVAWGRNVEGQTSIPPTLAKAVTIAAADNASGAVYAAPGAALPPLICSDPSANAGLGHPFQFNLMAKSSPTAFGAAGLPQGLSLNTTTGAITGTPTQYGTFRVAVTATNAFGTGREELELNIPAPSPIYSPNSLVPLGIAKLKSFDAGMGFGFSIGARADGTVQVWGTTDASLTPPAGLTDVVAVAAGFDFALALKADGTVVGWGTSGLVGQIPAGLHDVVAIDCGAYHAVALRATGAVVAWGSTVMSNAPTGFIKQVVSGGTYASGLRWDGQVHVWGGIFDIPGFPPGGLTGVTKLASSGTHTLALKSDGTVVGWGTNAFGQLTIPVGLNDAVDVAAGNKFSVALRSNGELVTWGQISAPIEAPAGVALSGIADHVLVLTQTEPSVAVPNIAMPRYLPAPPNFTFSTRIVAQNTPGAYGASGLPPGLSVNATTGIISGTPTMPGAYPVTLSATNGNGTGWHALTMIVPGATTYAQWAVSRGLAASSAMLDTDGDGLVDLMEYALGLDPTKPDAEGVGALRDAASLAGDQEMAFARPGYTADVIYEIQESSDLITWTTIGLGRAGSPMIDATDSGRVRELIMSPTAKEVAATFRFRGTAARKFARARFSLEPASVGTAPLYDLRAEDYANTGAWLNRGSVGGSFTAEGAPRAGSLGGGYLVAFKTTDSFVGPAVPPAMGGGTPHTIEIWANNNDVDNIETMLLFDGGRGEQFFAYGYGTNGASGALNQRFSPKYGWDPAFTANAPGGIVPPQGKWHHLAFVYSSTNLDIYVDGVLHRSVGVGIGLPLTPLRLGQEYAGSIGRLRVHGRALTALEVAAAHAAERSFYPANPPGAPLSAPPTHRYSFTLPAGAVTNGSVVADLVGTSPLIVKGAGAVSAAGQLDLPGGSSATAAYVDIPNGLANATPEVSLEFWFTPQSLGNYYRLFDMGSGTAGELNSPGGSATGGPDYLFYSSSAAAGPQHLFVVRRNNQDRSQTINGKFLNQEQHVVIIYSTAAGAWLVYNDGVKVAEMVTTDGPQAFPSLNTWIGRSNWTSDPNLDGKINEFRIYPRALTAGEVRGNFQNGPDIVNVNVQ